MMNASRRHEELTRQLDRIEVALLVRDPGTARSVEAYEGLRKTMVAAAQERAMHLVQLAQFDVALTKTDDISTLRRLVAEWMEQAGLLTLNDPSVREAFEVVEGKGEALEVLSPAYVDSATSRVIKQGQARAVRHEIRAEEASRTDVLSSEDESRLGVTVELGSDEDLVDSAPESGVGQ
jgi:hypothetical protein